MLSKKYADSAFIEINSAKKKDGNKVFYDLSTATVFNQLGGAAFQQGDFATAVQNNMKCLKIYETYGEKPLIAKALGNIGAILKAIGNKESINYFKRCISIEQDIYVKSKQSIRAKEALVMSYHNMGAVYLYFNNYDSSMFYFNRSLSLIDSTKKTDDLAIIYTGLAQTNKMKSRFELAIDYNKKALEIYLNIDDPNGTASIYNGFSDIYLEQGNYEKAIYYANLSEEINLKHQFNDELLYSYETKALAYDKLKDSKNELIYLKKHSRLKDSLLIKNRNLQIEELKTQYETEKKEKEIFKLNKDNKIQELQLEKERETRNRLITIIISIALVLLLLALLMFFLIRTVAERKRAYLKLQEKNIEIQNQSEKLSEQSKLISRYQSQMSTGFIFAALKSIKDLVVNDQTEKTIQQLQLFSKLMRETLNSSDKENITLETEINYLKTYLEFEQQRLTNNISLVLDLPDDLDEILIPPMMIQPFIERIIDLANDKKIIKNKIDLSITVENELLKIKINYNIKLDAGDIAIYKIERSISTMRSRMEMFFSSIKKEMKPSYFLALEGDDLAKHPQVEFCLPLIYKY
ncbi:MAG: tetratricopeptide repeat protein [Bacteroidetes bacterium]|nr:tetratricopeptide repeat protein [Bacteroidota bacterium]